MHDSKHELGQFLRSRRDRLRPIDVGLPTAGRRRAPGLRREEVAQLAGVGVTWYTWLEQGREINASEQVLEAIARALHLDDDERRHLFTLADAHVEVPASSPKVDDVILTLLDKLMPFPACVQTARYDLLAYNRGYRFLIEDLDELPSDDRNCILQNFLNPDWRTACLFHEHAMADMVARLRANSADHLGEPGWKDLIERLKTSQEFRDLWSRNDVRRTLPAFKQFRNRLVGSMSFTSTSLWLGERSDTRLVTFTPSDATSHERLERLVELTADVPELTVVHAA